MGKKRASPGVDIEKNPLGDVGLSDAHNDGLDEICEEARRVDIQIGMRRYPLKYIVSYLIPYWVLVEFLSIEKTDPFLRKRREVLKSIPKFWPTALSNHPIFQIHVAHNQDQDALNYLEDVWLARDPEEKRCFTLEFVRCDCHVTQPRSSYTELQYFRENPYFSDPVLKKEYRYIPPADIDDEKDEWNVTNTQAAFAWSVNVVPQVPAHVLPYLRQPFTLFRFLGY